MRRLILGASVGWLGISMVADGVPAILLPYRLSQAGSSDASTLGLVTLVGIGLAALVQPFAGRWSDVVGRFPVIAAGIFTTIAGMVLLLMPGRSALALLGAVVVLLGASVAQAGQQALLPDSVRREQRGLGAGAKGAFDVGGALLGFLVLAALLGTGDLVAAVAILIATLAGTAVVGYVLLPTSDYAGIGAERPGWRWGREVFSLDISERGELMRLIFARFLFLLAIYVVGRFLFLYIGARFGLDAEATSQQAGLILAALALVTVVASMPTGWLADRLGRRPMMLFGGLSAAVGVGLLPFAGSPAVLLAIGALIAIGSAGFSAGSWALLADLAADRDTGRLLGLAHLGTAGAAAAAGAFGLVIDAGEQLMPQVGFGLTFGLAALCALAGGVLGWRLTPDRMPTTDASSSVEVIA